MAHCALCMTRRIKANIHIVSSNESGWCINYCSICMRLKKKPTRRSDRPASRQAIAIGSREISSRSV